MVYVHKQKYEHEACATSLASLADSEWKHLFRIKNLMFILSDV